MGSDGIVNKRSDSGHISIHAPRMGSDHFIFSCRTVSCDFNPRSPHGERPLYESPGRTSSTNFNPRSPHGERLASSTSAKHGFTFQSTLPAWGATNAGLFTSHTIPNFNPRSPHGERLTIIRSTRHRNNFNPRSPHGERQGSAPRSGGTFGISIHAPRMGSDIASTSHIFGSFHFNPRSPHGERRRSELIVAAEVRISIHAPRMGSDPLVVMLRLIVLKISIHAPRMGSDATMTFCASW